jgi:hypothetical protein
MNKRMNVFYFGAAAALVLGLLGQPGAALVSGDEPETFTALAADLSTTGNGGTGRIDITITRWSTPEEREQLRTVLVEKGTDAVYASLAGVPAPHL